MNAIRDIDPSQIVNPIGLVAEFLVSLCQLTGESHCD